MNSTYTELRIAPSAELEQFSDLIFSLGVDAIEYDENSLVVRSEDELDMIILGVEHFAKSIGVEVTIKREVKNNQDWIEEYRSSIQPVEVENIYIHPSWDPPKPNLINVCIDPALAFGSGHHQSTFGCLKALQHYLPSNATLLDVGCGSGILAIASAKLGAKVSACDTDELAVFSATSNAKLNEVSFEQSWIGSIGEANKKYTVVVANIIADILLILKDELVDALEDDGILILSGILDKYKDRIKSRFVGVELIECYELDEWCTMIFKKKGFR